MGRGLGVRDRRPAGIRLPGSGPAEAGSIAEKAVSPARAVSWRSSPDVRPLPTGVAIRRRLRDVEGRAVTSDESGFGRPSAGVDEVVAPAVPTAGSSAAAAALRLAPMLTDDVAAATEAAGAAAAVETLANPRVMSRLNVMA